MATKYIKKGEFVNNAEEFLAEWSKDQLLPPDEVLLSILTAPEVLDYVVTDHGELKDLNFAQEVTLYTQMMAQQEAISQIFRTAHFQKPLNPLYSEIIEQSKALVNRLGYGDFVSHHALNAALRLIHDAMKKEPDAIADFWSESTNAVLYPISQVTFLSESQISVPKVGVVDLQKMPDLPKLMEIIALADYVGIKRVGDEQTFHLITIKKKGQSAIERILAMVNIWPDRSTRPPLVVVGMDFKVRGGGVVRAHQMSLEDSYIEKSNFNNMEVLFTSETVEEAFGQMKKLCEEKCRSFFVVKENLDREKLIADMKLSYRGCKAAIVEAEVEQLRQGWERYTEFLNRCENELFAVTITIDESTPSSKLCSNCGHITSSDCFFLTFECSRCGLEMERDINAAVNIAKAGFKMIQDRMRWLRKAKKGVENPNRCPSDAKTVRIGHYAHYFPSNLDIQMNNPEGECGNVSLLPTQCIKRSKPYQINEMYFAPQTSHPTWDISPAEGDPLNKTRLIVPPGVPIPEWLIDDNTAA